MSTVLMEPAALRRPRLSRSQLGLVGAGAIGLTALVFAVTPAQGLVDLNFASDIPFGTFAVAYGVDVRCTDFTETSCYRTFTTPFTESGLRESGSGGGGGGGGGVPFPATLVLLVLGAGAVVPRLRRRVHALA